MKVIAYYRIRPSEPTYSNIALQEQREAVKTWIEGRQAIVQAEYVEPETDGFSRPQLRQAMEDCKQSSATLLIARTEAIGSGLEFSPRISSIPVAFAPEPSRERGYVTLTPEKAPPDLALYFPDFRSLRIMPVYLCNGTDAPIYDIAVRTIGVTSKFSMPAAADGIGSASEQPLSTTPTAFSLDRLDARHAAVIDRYDPMFDSDFITTFEITFLDQHKQTQRLTALLNAAPLSSAHITLKK
ncbi:MULTISPECIES: recombinase family protein [unclassified Afipia]|uniref:recombinase family protein n=1 Tax=unclassified Afipia TaxID=2642050 RepID=UPI000408F3AE|nr:MULTISPECIES: recombinase family protein [unclassified Afipia]